MTANVGISRCHLPIHILGICGPSWAVWRRWRLRPSKPADDEGHVDEELPSRNVGEVADPQLGGPVSVERPIESIEWTRHLRVRDCRSHALAAHHASQSERAHQALHGAADHLDALAIELLPDLVGAVGADVGVPHAIKLGHQSRIEIAPRRTLRRIASTLVLAPVHRRSNPQDLADRLDPETSAVLVGECHYDFERRRKRLSPLRAQA